MDHGHFGFGRQGCSSLQNPSVAVNSAPSGQKIRQRLNTGSHQVLFDDVLEEKREVEASFVSEHVSVGPVGGDIVDIEGCSNHFLGDII